MIWRWSLLKQAALDFEDDDFGNDPAAQWLRQQQQQPQVTPVAPVAPMAPQVDTSPPPTFNQTPAEQPAEEAAPAEGRGKRKEREQGLVTKWQQELASIQQLAIEVFGPTFKLYEQQSGIKGGETGVFKSLFESGISRSADWKKFFARLPGKDERGRPVSGGYNLLPPQLQRGPGPSTVEAINQDLETTPDGQTPLSLQTLKDLISEQNEEVFRLFTEAGRSVNSLQQGGGESGSKEMGEGGGQRYDILEDVRNKAAPKSDLGTHMEESEIVALDDIAELFSTSQSNAQFMSQFDLAPIQEAMSINEPLKQSLKSPENALNEAVHDAFKGEGPDGRNLWVKFFTQNPDLLPGNVNPKEIASYLDLPPFGHAEDGWKIMKQLASGGDQRLQNFFKQPIQDALEERSLNYGVKRIDNWKTVNRDVSRISLLARGAALREMELARQSNKRDKSSGHWYLMLKHKMKLATNRLNEVLQGKELNLAKQTAKDEPFNLVSIPSGKGRIMMLKDLRGQLHEVNASQFEQLSRIVSPTEWMPSVIKDMKTKYPNLIIKPSREEGRQSRSAFNEPLRGEFDSALDKYQQDAVQQGLMKKDPNDPPNAPPRDASENFDRLGGWRKLLSQKVGAFMQSAGVQPQELLETWKSGKGLAGPNLSKDPEGWLNKVLAGQPAPYSFKDMNQLGNTIAQLAQKKGSPVQVDPENPSFNFYDEPKEYDEYNHEDIGVRMSENLPQGFRDYGPTLLHRKREAEWRGVPFYNPASLQIFLAVARIHPNFFKKGEEKPFGKMLMELTGGKPAGVSMDPQSAEEALKGVDIDKPSNMIYDKSPSIRQKFRHQPHGKGEKNTPTPAYMRSNEYEHGVDEQGKPTMYQVPKEPDLEHMDKALKSQEPEKYQMNARKKTMKLYQILENPSSPPEERAHAVKELDKLRDQINQMPPKQRARFKHYLYPYRHVYDPQGNPVRIPGRRAMQVIERIIKAANQITRLAKLQLRMEKFADVNYIDQLMDAIADEALIVGS